MRCCNRETCASCSANRRAKRRPAARSRRVGFSLVELLIVVAVMAVLTGLLLPRSESTAYDQLRSAAHIVRTDLAYAQSLAVANNSNYRITFDVDENQYVLEHVGANTSLNTLPDSVFRSPDDPPDKHIVDLAALPRLGSPVQVVAVGAMGASAQRVDGVEFGPLGETTRGEQTAVWLAVESGKEKRYIWLLVNPVTGLTEIGDCTTAGPPSQLGSAAAESL